MIVKDVFDVNLSVLISLAENIVGIPEVGAVNRLTSDAWRPRWS
jgi:hypothetical protein